MAPRQSLSEAIAAERARRVPDAVATERARCLAIDAAIAEPQTGVSALVRAIRRAERAIQEGEKGEGKKGNESESEVHRAR